MALGISVHQPAGHPGTRRGSAGGRRSRCGWRCVTWPGTRPAPARRWPRSAWPWGSPRRSSSARPPTRPPPARATCRTARCWSGSASRRRQPARSSHPDARRAERPGRRRAPDRRIAAACRRDRPRHARQPGRQAAARRPGQPGRTAGSNWAPGRTRPPAGAGSTARYPLYVATPAVLRYLGISPATITPATDILTVQAGQLVAHHHHHLRDRHPRAADPGPVLRLRAHLADDPGRPAPASTGRRYSPAGSSSPARPLTAAQLAAARDVAAKAGLIIEARNSQASLATISAAATAAGALLALGVLAMTVALIRTEAAGDLRTLTAAGATSTTRRTLTAATAGALALLGALLGTAARLPRAGRRTPQRPRRAEPGATPRTSPSPFSAFPSPPPWPAGSSPGASHHPSPARCSTDSLTDRGRSRASGHGSQSAMTAGELCFPANRQLSAGPTAAARRNIPAAARNLMAATRTGRSGLDDYLTISPERAHRVGREELGWARVPITLSHCGWSAASAQVSADLAPVPAGRMTVRAVAERPVYLRVSAHRASEISPCVAAGRRPRGLPAVRFGPVTRPSLHDCRDSEAGCRIYSPLARDDHHRARRVLDDLAAHRAHQ